MVVEGADPHNMLPVSACSVACHTSCGLLHSCRQLLQWHSRLITVLQVVGIGLVCTVCRVLSCFWVSPWGRLHCLECQGHGCCLECWGCQAAAAFSQTVRGAVCA